MRAEAGWLGVAGVRTRVLQAGRGRPLILLHGLGASSYSWRSVMGPLSRSRRVVACDLPGFGRSEKPRDFDYSLAGFSRWVLSLIDELGVGEADLAGNSMGGVVALRCALERPERVGRLVLLGSPVYPHNVPKLLWPMRWPVLGRLYELCLGPWVVRPIARTAFHDPSFVTDELVEEYARGLKARGGRRAVARFIRGAIPPDAADWMARYRGLEAPVLFIRGEHDGVVDRASAERFCREVPRGRLLPVADCGHAPQEEKPRAVLEALDGFLP